MSISTGINRVRESFRRRTSPSSERDSSSSSTPASRPSSPNSERSRSTTGTRPSESDSVELSPQARSRTSASSSESSSSLRRRRQSSPQTDDRTNLSSQTNSADAAERAEERRRQEERDHIANLDENFALFDNPGGGRTDGVVSRNDIEKIAEGDFNRERAEERLREAGVSQREIDDRLESIQETADYLLENDSVFDRLDVANDNDGNGRTDGKISRGDIDKVMLEVEAENREARVREAERVAQEPPSENHIREAQGAVDRWIEPGALERELGDRPLADFSAAELDALAAVNEQNPQARQKIEQAVLRTIDGAESLEDLPTGDAFSYLLDNHVTGQEVRGNEAQLATHPTAVAQRQLDALVREEIEGSLDRRLEDRRGDGELDLALERVSGDLEDLAIDHPALINSIQSQAEATFEEYADEFTDVARRDDNFLQRANHAVTGGIRDGVGFIADGFRFAVDVTARVSTAPTRLAGRVANFGLDVGGSLAGAGLDAVGANGAADSVRRVTDQLGDGIQNGADFLADQNENFTRGLGESVAGAAEGLAYVATDPVGTVQGLAQIVQDPSLLLEGYRETAREHGAAGAAGQVTGDVLLTVFTAGSGAAARGASAAGRVANLASRGGRTANVVSRTAARSGNFLDDVSRAGGPARYARQAPQRRDINGAIASADGLRQQTRHIDAQLQRQNPNHLPVANQIENFTNQIGDVRLPGGGTDRAALLRVLEDSRGLATRLDDVTGLGGRPPAGAGELVQSGRANILNHLIENIDVLGPDTVRRTARGLLSDGESFSTPFLTRLQPDSQVLRVFGDGTGPNGNYFALAADRIFSPGDQIRNSALPVNNSATRGVLVNVGEESLALVTRTARQTGDGFHNGALGGGWQLQFLDNTSIGQRLSQLAENLSELPDGVVRANPRSQLLPLPVGPVLPHLDTLEEIQQ